MWGFYDDLIDGIPSDIEIKDFVIGTDFAMVISDVGAGISRVLKDRRFLFDLEIKRETSLKKFSKLIKSWNFVEASLGLAAINSFYNGENVEELENTEEIKDFLIHFIKDKPNEKLAIVENNLKNKNKIRSSYDVDFFSRKVEDGDYYISAFEYLCENYGGIYLGGDLIINKHLIKIAKDSFDKESVISDISIPLTSGFTNLGIKQVTGFVIDDEDKCFNLVKMGGTTEEILKTGRIIKSEF